MFKEKETLLQNMAFMAIIAAIDVVMAILSALFPVAGVFIMILLPFFSAVVALLCKWRYYPIYAIAAIGVSFIAMAWNASYTVFYLLPSLLTGFLFGVSFRKKMHPTYALLMTSIVQCAMTFVFIPLIDFLYEVNTIEQFLFWFKVSDIPYIHEIVLPFVYFISLVQMVFSYIVLTNELKKFHYEENYLWETFLPTFGFVFTLLVIPCSFISTAFAYFFMMLALFIGVHELVQMISKKEKVIAIISGAGIFLSIVLVFSLYQVVKMPHTLLLFNSANLIIFVTRIVYNLRRKQIC